jgi:hypothetical protein
MFSTSTMIARKLAVVEGSLPFTFGLTTAVPNSNAGYFLFLGPLQLSVSRYVCI